MTLRIAVAILAVHLLLGCQSEQHYKAVKAYESHFTPEWLKANVVPGTTTSAEVLAQLGKPMSKTTQSNAILGFDEMWVYAVQFSELSGKLGDGVRRTGRSVVVNFKDGKVVNFSTSEVGGF